MAADKADLPALRVTPHVDLRATACCSRFARPRKRLDLSRQGVLDEQARRRHFLRGSKRSGRFSGSTERFQKHASQRERSEGRARIVTVAGHERSQMRQSLGWMMAQARHVCCQEQVIGLVTDVAATGALEGTVGLLEL